MVNLLDLIFPKYCVNCKKIGDYLCVNCFSRLSYDTKNICLPCGNPSFDGLTHPKCRGRYTIEGSFTGVVFSPVSKKLIYKFKYKPYLSNLSEFMTDLLYESLIQNEEFDRILKQACPEEILNQVQNDTFRVQDDNPQVRDDIFFVPIPLSNKRYKKRGYNQAEILSKKLSKKIGAETVNGLERIKETRSQVGLDKKKRRENVKNAFSVKKKYGRLFVSKNVILIDDVLTTGATFSEAANVLKRSGAKKVWALAFAREQ